MQTTMKSEHHAIITEANKVADSTKLVILHFQGRGGLLSTSAVEMHKKNLRMYRDKLHHLMIKNGHDYFLCIFIQDTLSKIDDASAAINAMLAYCADDTGSIVPTTSSVSSFQQSSSSRSIVQAGSMTPTTGVSERPGSLDCNASATSSVAGDSLFPSSPSPTLRTAGGNTKSSVGTFSFQRPSLPSGSPGGGSSTKVFQKVSTDASTSVGHLDCKYSATGASSVAGVSGVSSFPTSSPGHTLRTAGENTNSSVGSSHPSTLDRSIIHTDRMAPTTGVSERASIAGGVSQFLSIPDPTLPTTGSTESTAQKKNAVSDGRETGEEVAGDLSVAATHHGNLFSPSTPTVLALSHKTRTSLALGDSEGTTNPTLSAAMLVGRDIVLDKSHLQFCADASTVGFGGIDDATSTRKSTVEYKLCSACTTQSVDGGPWEPTKIIKKNYGEHVKACDVRNLHSTAAHHIRYVINQYNVQMDTLTGTPPRFPDGTTAALILEGMGGRLQKNLVDEPDESTRKEKIYRIRRQAIKYRFVKDFLRIFMPTLWDKADGVVDKNSLIGLSDVTIFDRFGMRYMSKM